MICKATLSKLRKGSEFQLDGMKGKLIYVTECRARIKFTDTNAEANWSPNTVVEVNRRITARDLQEL